MSETDNERRSSHADGRTESISEPRLQQRQTCSQERLVPLLILLREGSAHHPRACATLIETVQRPVRSFLQRRAERCGFDVSFVDDVVQDALARIAMSAHRCKATSDASAMAWVFAVARSAWSDTLRREGPARLALDDPGVHGAALHSFDESWGHRQEVTPALEILLQTAVDVSLALPTETGTLLWMRLIANEDWSHIGSSLGLSATAARRRFQRAQRTMRRLVRERLSTLSAPQRSLAHSWLVARIGDWDTESSE